MKSIVYSRWDGSQQEFLLDADEALRSLSDLMMEGLDVREALEWMQRYGFELGGLDMRVMGMDELQAELRQEIESLYDRYRMDRAMEDLRGKLEEILDREQAALASAHGYESSRMNDFLGRRHADTRQLSDAIEQFRDYEFEDEEAAESYRELLEELDRMRDLERFLREQANRFRGAESADYETAQQIRERIESLEALAKSLAEGNFQQISPEELRDLLGDDAARSLVLLRDLESGLEQAGYLRGGPDSELTPKAIRKIGAHALAEVYAGMRKDRPGAHETDLRGAALPRPDETRPWVFGEPLDLEVVRTILNGVRRRAAEGGGAGGLPIDLSLDDFEVRECDFSTQATTVLLLDMSWSMSWAGRFPAAKRVALALDHLIRTRFPRDDFFVVGFSTRAKELSVEQLPEVSWDLGDPFTNLQEGLMLAERLIAKHPSASPQVLVITDGQPTAYFKGKQLRVEWPMGFGGVSPHAVAETMKQVRRITRRGVTINTFMLDDAPELVGFVEHMTLVNRGRALFSRPDQLGSFLVVDYLNGKRKRRV
jgi:uncharacterized protein with von Willebrand factor type A (vWA) domain